MKKYNLLIFMAIFSMLFGIVVVKAEEPEEQEIIFEKNKSRELLPASQCDFDETAKIYLDTTGFILTGTYLIVKRVPEMGFATANITCHSANPFKTDQYNIKVKIDHSASIDSAAETYKESEDAGDYVERETIDLTSGHEFYKLNSYTNCTVSSDISSNVSVTNMEGYATFKKLSDPVGIGTDIGKNKTYEVTCHPVLNLQKSVNFDLEMTLVSQEEANDDSKYINQTVTVSGSQLFPEYKSCILNNGGSDYVKIHNQSNGVFIEIKKTNLIFKETIDIDCVTQQNNNATLHLKIPHNAVTGTNGIYATGKEDTVNEDKKKDDNSKEVGSDCVSILGSVNQKGDVAYYLQKIFNFMKFLGPVLAICLIIMDSIKGVTSGDKDALNKLLTSSAKRIIFVVLLYIFPTVLNLILGWISTHGTCNIT